MSASGVRDSVPQYQWTELPDARPDTRMFSYTDAAGSRSIDEDVPKI